MNFQVTFRRENGNYIWEQLKTDVGLNSVDQVREKEKLPNLAIERFSNDLVVPYGRIDPPLIDTDHSQITIEVYEDFARKCGHFLEENNIIVLVHHAPLSQYYCQTYNLSKTDNGEIHEVLFYIFPSKTQILEQWERDGFPLQWGVESHTDEQLGLEH